MNIQIVCVGKLKEPYLKEGIDEYAKRLSRFCKFEIVEVSEEPLHDGSKKSIERVKIAEGERIIAKLKGYSIALDLNGKKLSSINLSEKISELKLNGVSALTFVIGGSYGLSQQLLDKCDHIISFGAITFPHQLMRLMLAEQIYRAFTIEEGSPYHK